MKFVVGKKADEVALEENERLKEIAEEVQKRNAVFENNMRIIQNKKKKAKILVFTLLGAFGLTLFFWGTYSTFFKKNLGVSDVQTIINKTVNQFPEAGLDGYIRKNFDKWFSKLATFQDKDIESVTANLDSLSIDSVIPVTENMSRVYFSVDLVTKHKDIKDSAGNVTTTGKEETNRYNFYIPVEYYSNYNDKGQKTVSGYRPVEQLCLYTLNRIDSSEKVDNNALTFSSELEDKETTESAKVKVDKTLDDLYSGRDTSQDFLNYLTFNNYGAKYGGITEFKLYQQPNAMGYNAKVTYTVITKEGFTYTTTSYLLVTKSDKTWVIRGSL